MGTITSAAELKNAIQLLELEQTICGQQLKEHFFLTYESFKPASLIRDTLNDIATSPYLADNMLGAALGLVSGYISKKLAVGESSSMLRKLLGSVLQFGVTNLVAQHPETIKSIARFLLQYVIPKRNK